MTHVLPSNILLLLVFLHSHTLPPPQSPSQVYNANWKRNPPRGSSRLVSRFLPGWREWSEGSEGDPAREQAWSHLQYRQVTAFHIGINRKLHFLTFQAFIVVFVSGRHQRSERKRSIQRHSHSDVCSSLPAGQQIHTQTSFCPARVCKRKGEKTVCIFLNKQNV